MTTRIGVLFALTLCLAASPAHAQDAQLCFSTADLVKMGNKLNDADKQQAHDA